MKQRRKPYAPVAFWNAVQWRALERFLRGGAAAAAGQIVLDRSRAPRAAKVSRPSPRKP